MKRPPAVLKVRTHRPMRQIGAARKLRNKPQKRPNKRLHLRPRPLPVIRAT